MPGAKAHRSRDGGQRGVERQTEDQYEGDLGKQARKEKRGQGVTQENCRDRSQPRGQAGRGQGPPKRNRENKSDTR